MAKSRSGKDPGISYSETLESRKREVTNGDIPVKYEYADLFYDVKENCFYMHTKVGYKKITLEEVKSNETN